MPEWVHTSTNTEEVNCPGTSSVWPRTCSHKPCLKYVHTPPIQPLNVLCVTVSQYKITIQPPDMHVDSEIKATDLSEANRDVSEIGWKRIITSNCLFPLVCMIYCIQVVDVSEESVHNLHKCVMAFLSPNCFDLIFWWTGYEDEEEVVVVH